MFDTVKVGANISKCRKVKNMTQVDLADMLEVSYQAVSNWERGQSMPDISKLPELAGVLGVTIDELLGVTKQDTDIVTTILKDDTEKLKNELTMPMLSEITPILKPSKINELVELTQDNLTDLSIDTLKTMAIHLSSEKLVELLLSKKQALTVAELAAVALYVENEDLEKLVTSIESVQDEFEAIQKLGEYNADSSILKELILKCVSDIDANCLGKIAVFMNESDVDECISRLRSDTKFSDLEKLFIYCSKAATELVVDRMATISVEGIEQVAIYMSEEALMKALRRVDNLKADDIVDIARYLKSEFLGEIFQQLALNDSSPKALAEIALYM